jgi:cytochrome c-type biogenesis protein CcmH/NrfG
VLIALGRVAYFVGDHPGCLDAAAVAGRAAGSAELMGEVALVLEAAPDPCVNAAAKQLCEEALAGLGDGDQGHVESLSMGHWISHVSPARTSRWSTLACQLKASFIR